MKDLKIIRNKLQQRKAELEADVPNHGFDSALAMSAQVGGIEEAIQMIDETIKPKTKGKKFKLD